MREVTIEEAIRTVKNLHGNPSMLKIKEKGGRIFLNESPSFSSGSYCLVCEGEYYSLENVYINYYCVENFLDEFEEILKYIDKPIVVKIKKMVGFIFEDQKFKLYVSNEKEVIEDKNDERIVTIRTSKGEKKYDNFIVRMKELGFEIADIERSIYYYDESNECFWYDEYYENDDYDEDDGDEDYYKYVESDEEDEEDEEYDDYYDKYGDLVVGNLDENSDFVLIANYYENISHFPRKYKKDPYRMWNPDELYEYTKLSNINTWNKSKNVTEEESKKEIKEVTAEEAVEKYKLFEYKPGIIHVRDQGGKIFITENPSYCEGSYCLVDKGDYYRFEGPCCDYQYDKDFFEYFKYVVKSADKPIVIRIQHLLGKRKAYANAEGRESIEVAQKELEKGKLTCDVVRPNIDEKCKKELDDFVCNMKKLGFEINGIYNFVSEVKDRVVNYEHKDVKTKYLYSTYEFYRSIRMTNLKNFNSEK